MFYVRPESPFKTIQDVIKFAKENPGKLQFTGTTAAIPDEVIIMLFVQKAGIKVKYMPFDAAPESHAAVLAGHIDVLQWESSAFGGVPIFLLRHELINKNGIRRHRGKSSWRSIRRNV